MKRKLAIFIHHGMASISASLISDNDIIIFRQQVDHSPFAFVTQLIPTIAQFDILRLFLSPAGFKYDPANAA